MGRAIIGGLLAQGYKKDLLVVIDPDANAREQVSREFGIAVAPVLKQLDDAEVVLLAVKPRIMKSVVNELGRLCAHSPPLFISIAAGITTAQLARWLASEAPIVRVMPNMPALVGHGAAALFATANVDAAERQAAESIMEAVGSALWLENEDLMDVVTALSGSGPAYFFLVMEILERVAVDLGLDTLTARKLTLDTALGAATLARESEIPPGTLRERVTSPGGTTEQALAILHSGNIEGLFREALTAAHSRSRELAAAWGQET